MIIRRKERTLFSNAIKIFISKFLEQKETIHFPSIQKRANRLLLNVIIYQNNLVGLIDIVSTTFYNLVKLQLVMPQNLTLDNYISSYLLIQPIRLSIQSIINETRNKCQVLENEFDLPHDACNHILIHLIICSINIFCYLIKICMIFCENHTSARIY